MWRSGPDTRTIPAVLPTLPPSKAADMAHLCAPQNQAGRRFTEDLFLPSKIRHSREKGSHRTHKKKRRKKKKKEKKKKEEEEET